MSTLVRNHRSLSTSIIYGSITPRVLTKVTFDESLLILDKSKITKQTLTLDKTGTHEAVNPVFQLSLAVFYILFQVRVSVLPMTSEYRQAS